MRNGFSCEGAQSEHAHRDTLTPTLHRGGAAMETWEALKVALGLALGVGGVGMALVGVLMLLVQAILGPVADDGEEE